MVCKDNCICFQKNRQKYRTCHIKNRLHIAKNKSDEEVESRILVITVLVQKTASTLDVSELRDEKGL